MKEYTVKSMFMSTFYNGFFISISRKMRKTKEIKFILFRCDLMMMSFTGIIIKMKKKNILKIANNEEKQQKLMIVYAYHTRICT